MLEFQVGDVVYYQIKAWPEDIDSYYYSGYDWRATTGYVDKRATLISSRAVTGTITAIENDYALIDRDVAYRYDVVPLSQLTPIGIVHERNKGITNKRQNER